MAAVDLCWKQIYDICEVSFCYYLKFKYKLSQKNLLWLFAISELKNHGSLTFFSCEWGAEERMMSFL